LPPVLLQMLLENGSVDPACVGQPPTSEVMLQSMDLTMALLYGGLTLLTALCTAVYLEEVVYLQRKIQCPYKRKTLVWINGAAPVISITSCIGLWIPRSAMFTDYTASIYFAICIHQFMVMMVQEYGGEEALVRRFHGSPIPISTGPCCCCCLCLPRINLTRRNLAIIQCGTFQVAFLRPVLLFLGAVLWTNGTYNPEKMSVTGAYLWISCISGLATIISLWAIGIMFSHARTNLASLNIIPKFALNQMILILSSLQLAILAMLGTAGTVACVPPFPSRARAASMNQQLLVVEMFLVALVSRGVYRRRYDAVAVTVEASKLGGGEDGGAENGTKGDVIVRT
ncbi:organic solute transporter subunit alpha-like, partial [Lampetra planeri]